MKYMNKFCGAVFGLTLSAGAAIAEPATCKVITFDVNGAYLAQVYTGDKVALTCSEAGRIAALLNARHNNGENPIIAKVFKK